MNRSSLAVPALLVQIAILPAGCKSEGTRRCHELMTSAQGIVKDVDSKDLGSVETSLSAVEGALAACTEAGRTGEADELLKAKNQLKGHADYMKARAARTPVKKLSPEETAALAKNGDPSCPKGQAYRHTQLGKEIRCTGPQPSDMSWKKADEYYSNRGYKMTRSDAPPTLKAEYGAELFVYTYATPKDEGPPRCLTIYPPPGMAWQEAAARATGVGPKKLDKAKNDGVATVKTDRGELPLAIEDSESKVVIRIGNCS